MAERGGVNERENERDRKGVRYKGTKEGEVCVCKYSGMTWLTNANE